jgi:hypothetical protein
MNDKLIEGITLWQEKKSQMVKEAIKKKGISIDWELEEKRRFKSIICEYHKDSGLEHYYYNDGSINGLLLISFDNLPKIITT